jgi:hypothetical protein
VPASRRIASDLNWSRRSSSAEGTEERAPRINPAASHGRTCPKVGSPRIRLIAGADSTSASVNRTARAALTQSAATLCSGRRSSRWTRAFPRPCSVRSANAEMNTAASAMIPKSSGVTNRPRTTRTAIEAIRAPHLSSAIHPIELALDGSPGAFPIKCADIA